jgi:hypothetical protein
MRNGDVFGFRVELLGSSFTVAGAKALTILAGSGTTEVVP